MISFANREPKIAADVFVADTASVIGDVEIGSGSSVWFGAVVRADNNTIRIGENVNVQDGAIIHEDHDAPVVIGNDVTIGHAAIVHGCTVGDRVLIGMGAILMNDCKIGNDCVIAAGALITSGTQVPDRSLVMGAPAKTIKPLSDVLHEEITLTCSEYRERASQFRRGEFCKAEPQQ